MMNIFRSKLLLLRKQYSLLHKVIKYNSNMSTSKPASQESNIRITSEFKIRPDDIDDYVVIGSEIFKNAFKESLMIAEKEPDIVKRTELIIDEMDKNSELYGISNMDFKYPPVKER